MKDIPVTKKVNEGNMSPYQIYPFDQYQRYKTMQILVDEIKRLLKIDHIKVLEIGANEHRNLESFLPGDTVYFSDVSLPEEMLSDPHCFIADASDLKEIADNEFDVVIACDVFEHVDSVKREAFIKELYRVSKYAALLCFPFFSDHNIAVENRANEFFKAYSGQNHRWLQEHIDNVLPKIDDIEQILSKNNMLHISFEHGAVEVWEALMIAHFYSVFYLEILNYKSEFDHYYNENLYCVDRNDKNYRVFYVLSENSVLLDELISYINCYYGTISQREIDTLESFNSTLLGLLNTYNLQVIQNAVRDVFSLSLEMKGLLQDKQMASVYFDRGNGYSEEDKLQFEIKNNSLTVRFNVPSGIKKIRFDPFEAVGLVYHLQVKSNNGNLYPITNPSLFFNDVHIFSIQDPYFEFFVESFEWIEISAELMSSGNVSFKKAIDLLIQLNEHHEWDKKQFQREKEEFVFAQNHLQDHIQNLQNTVQAYETAFYWRLTKPLRMLTEGLKKLVRFYRRKRAEAAGLRRNERSFKSYLDAITPSPKDLDSQLRVLRKSDIKISVVVPLYNTVKEYLIEMIQSVQNQHYANWELCLADGSDDTHTYIQNICEKLARKDQRIVYRKLASNKGIAENSNSAMEMATGNYIALLDHDDIIHPSALLEMANAICIKGADFVYSDELTFDKNVYNPVHIHFKPDFAPDTFRSYNYMCHLTVFSKALLTEVGPFRSEYDGSQDYDLFLRLTEKAQKIIHIPKVLYYWRAYDLSTSKDVSAKPFVSASGQKAISDHLNRVGLQGEVLDSNPLTTYKINYSIEDEPLISIIILNKDQKDTLRDCVESILQKTTYMNFEIIICENNSTSSDIFDYYMDLSRNPKIKVVQWQDEFNFSAINNYAVTFAKGEYLLFLNNDMEVISSDWLEEMLMFAQRKDVGAVGAKLYYPDDTIQHAGVILGIVGVAGHAHKYFNRPDHGYFSRLKIVQNLSAVTGACLLMRKEIFFVIGGFDESYKVAFNDIDLCLKIRKAGYLIVFTPFAELYHYESKSRGYEDTPEKQQRFESEILRFKKQWQEELADGDPYYNPNLTLLKEDFSDCLFE